MSVLTSVSPLTPWRVDHRQHRVHQKGHHVGQGGPAVHRHLGNDRRLSDRRVRRLRHRLGPGPGRPGPLPAKAGTCDRDRCRAAKIPDERGFATKGELARDIVRRCLAAGCPPPGSPRTRPTGRTGTSAGCSSRTRLPSRRRRDRRAGPGGRLPVGDRGVLTGGEERVLGGPLRRSAPGCSGIGAHAHSLRAVRLVAGRRPCAPLRCDVLRGARQGFGFRRCSRRGRPAPRR